MQNRFFILFFSILAFASACTTKVEVNAPYVETKVVYCIVDPLQPFQTARISKGFQNEGRSAADIARNSPDSSQYPTNVLIVKLLEINKSGQIRKTFLMKDSVVAEKDSGLFYYPDQMIFKTPNFVVDSLASYKLQITNSRTGSISEASTQVVWNNFRFRTPFLEKPGDPFYFSFSSKKDSKIEVYPTTNSEVMQAIMYWKIRVYSDAINFHDEIWKMDSPGEMILQSERTAPANGSVGPGYFWNFIANQVAERGNDGVFGRQFQVGEIEIAGASIDYKRYRQAFNNYNSITQSLPVYTNISNGLGVMASRNSRRFPLGLQKSTEDTLMVRVPQFKLIK